MRYLSKAAFFSQVQSAQESKLASRLYLISIPCPYERKKSAQILLELLGKNSLQTFQKFQPDLILDHLSTEGLFGGDPVAYIELEEKLSKNDLKPFYGLQYGYIVFSVEGKQTVLSDFIENEGIILDLCSEKPWEKHKRIVAELELKVQQKGLRFDPDALELLLEKNQLDLGFLDQEVDKIMLYASGSRSITLQHVAEIGSETKESQLWQMSEQIVWDKKWILDADQFHGLIPLIRMQLELGAKILSYLENSIPQADWNIGKVFPKTLQRRVSEANNLGKHYFQKGLQELFAVELLSRTGTTHFGALLDLFLGRLAIHGR
jgi:hypothetical protein